MPYTPRMNPHPRIRKTVKWGGAAVTVLLVVVWIGSAWVVLGWVTPAGHAVSIAAGQLCWGGPNENVPRFLKQEHGFVYGMRPFAFQWWGGSRQSSWRWQTTKPLWMLAGSTLLFTVAAWRLDTLARRRERAHLCPKCGYDRTGLRGGVGAVCPECGEPCAPPQISPPA